MGGTEPGTELGEEDIGAHSQQQGLLLDEPIPTSAKHKVKIGGNVPVCQVNGKTVQGSVWVFFRDKVVPALTQMSTKMGQSVRLIINPLRKKPLIMTLLFARIFLPRVFIFCVYLLPFAHFG